VFSKNCQQHYFGQGGAHTGRPEDLKKIAQFFKK